MKYFDFNTEDYDKLSISQLKRLTDFWLRQYLLNTTERSGGRYYCPLKQRWYSEDKMNVTHYYDRQIMCLRYSLENTRLVSLQSNQWDAQELVEGYKSKHHKEYEEYLISELGEKNMQELLVKSKKICIFARQDYIDLIEKFRDGGKES